MHSAAHSRLLHQFGALEPGQLTQSLVAVDNGKVDDASVGQQEVAVCNVITIDLHWRINQVKTGSRRCDSNEPNYIWFGSVQWRRCEWSLKVKYVIPPEECRQRARLPLLGHLARVGGQTTGWLAGV